MNAHRRRILRTFGCSLLCVALLSAPGGCTSQRAWNDTTPGPSQPDLVDIGKAILGIGYAFLYYFAAGASGGSGTSLDQYSYRSNSWR